jgi:hypothetical protein
MSGVTDTDQIFKVTLDFGILKNLLVQIQSSISQHDQRLLALES